MKKLLLASLISATLVGCGSKDENKTSAGGGAVPPSKIAQDQATCPYLSGKYSAAGDSIWIDTHIENGVHSYALDETDPVFVPATGEVKASPDGKTSVRLSCGHQALEVFVRQAGKADADGVITDIGNNQIRVDYDGKTAVYTKDGAAAPQPAPNPGPAPASDCPLLAGSYASDGGDTMVLSTQVQGAVYSYKLSADQQVFLPADGTMHEIPGQGSYRVACSLDGGLRSVSMDINQIGQQPISLRLTDLGAGTVRATANGQTEILHKR